MRINEIIQTNWKNNQLPGLDSLIYISGKVIIMDCYEMINGNFIEKFVNPICETSIESIMFFNENIWCEIDQHPQVQYHNDKIFICGEGGMGNEGFIANVDKNHNLIWAFFSTVSNPFNKLKLEDNLLTAYSTSDLIYTINIHKPEEISINTII
ncbi:hypothetical protein P9B03_16035 [Metasolibacillus meyeri]|uniref:Uncharacterized protein n=1 Tax=Metasolibacillus meyeri TaxID=1071052 RepID=A0AAW9NXN1_9BACL|nr:hypothetical protein [Metasolibacillus meyeri]MEC1180011.1 hypothetical protein [Metasolibacillus meyeri]